MEAAAKGGKQIVETAIYLTSSKKKQVDQIKGMKEKAHMREVANLINVPGRAHRDKTRAPPGNDKPDPTK